MGKLDGGRSVGKDQQRAQEGFGVKSGKVYSFNEDLIVVARVWPKPLAWTKRPGAYPWRHCRPHLDLDFPALRQQPENENSAWNSLVSAEGPRRWRLPEPLPESPRARQWLLVRERQLRKVLKAFEEVPLGIRQQVSVFRHRQWHVLAMVAATPESLDLIQSTPSLAFAMASNWVFHRPAVQRPLAAVRRWIPKRQRQIAGWLGFPETESTVHLLRKVPANSCGILPLLALRWMLQQDHRIDELRHLPRLHAPVLVALCRKRMSERIAPRLLREFADRVYGPDDICPLRLLSDTLHMARWLPEFPLPRTFQSVGAIRHAHDRIAELYLRYWRRGSFRFKSHFEIRFPDPPIEGDSRIVPLISPAMVLEEAMMQGNCCAAYLRRISRGAVYLYRVLQPERATLSVFRDAGGGWRIDQIAGSGNAPVRQRTLDAVENWIGGCLCPF